MDARGPITPKQGPSLRPHPAAGTNKARIMSWTHQDQGRLDHLRAKELNGTLVSSEDEELTALMARVEAEEAAVLAPAMARLKAEAADVKQQLSALQSGNEELAKRVAQQESLAADARRFLAELD